MNTPATPVAGSAVSSSRSLRFLRGLAWTGFVLGMVFVIALGIAPAVFGGGYGASAAIVGGAAVFLFALARVKSGSWRRLGLGYAGLGIVLAYLAVDDSQIRRPQTLEDIAPAFPGAEKSFATLMRYGKNHPLAHGFHFQPSAKMLHGEAVWRPKETGWKNWLLSNRAELESNWSQLEPVRAWWTELNTFDRIGDLTPTEMDAEIIAFAPIRAIVQHSCAIASLKALDGQGDAAVETLLPVLEVGGKLEASSRTLVRSMVAIVAQRMTLETAEFVLNTTEVSPASRARLIAAIEASRGGETAVRKLIGIEYAWAANLSLKRQIGDIVKGEFAESGSPMPAWRQRVMNPLSPFVYNSRHTINLYGDLSVELADLAARREFKEMDRRSEEFHRELVRNGFKNFGGAMVIEVAVPAYSKVVESYWKTDDLRTAVQTRLKT